MVEKKLEISYADFEKIGIYSGTIIRAELFERAQKPAYRIWADFGIYGILGTSSQVTAHYKSTELIGKKILGCINLGIKNIAGFKSEFLLLGCYDNNNQIVIPELLLPVPNGSLLS